MLPMDCLDEIESLCNAFLWSGLPNVHHKAKISWNDLCLAKCEGRLGIRKLRETSKVLLWVLSGSCSLCQDIYGFLGLQLNFCVEDHFGIQKTQIRVLSFGVNCLNSDQRPRGLCDVKLEVASRPSFGLMIG